MNTTNASPRGTNKTALEAIDRKARLSTLWIFVMFNMVFADIFSFMYPGFLQQIMTGYVEQVEVTPEFLLIAAMVTEISIAMVFLSRLLKYPANRWANIIGGLITILWVIGGGSTTLHYMFFATIEVVCTLFIIWYAWNWRSSEVSRHSMTPAQSESGGKA
jgi:hypothetical protein